MLDNDMSSKFIEEGFEDAVRLLVRAHPTNCHMIKFDDIDEKDEPQAFDEFRVLLLRLLRYVCSLEKNRKIFKRIFPPELLGPFFDIGHFVKPPEAYLKTLKAFN
jgi:NIMA (never in mitosis gene a)-related kinase